MEPRPVGHEPLRDAVRRVMSRIVATHAGNIPDASLLDRFAQQKDEGAFEALVRRHGPMVFGVCRRLLQNTQDAEDAFQATFLVFVRKLDSIRRTAPLAAWLYGVAYNTARKARTVRRRRSWRAVSGERAEEILRQAPTSNGNAVSELEARELQKLLDAELHRLPEKYRLPIVLCCLEDKTKEEAARQLGWPEGTVSGRLARGREMLRNRLDRRGLELPAGVFAATLAHNTASAAVPITLIMSTAKAAALIASGQTAAGLVSASVAGLTQGVLKAMFLTKIKIAAAVILAVGVFGTGAGVATYRTLLVGPADAADLPAKAADKAKNKEREQPSPAKVSEKEMTDEDRIQGTWQAAWVRPDQQIGVVFPGISIELPTFVFAANKFSGSGYSECFFKLNANKKPKEIDLVFSNGRIHLGIYEFEGDSLKLALSGGARPAGFDVHPQHGPPVGETHYGLKRKAPAARMTPPYVSKLKPDERAFMIQVPVNSVASFMTAGDKVDVVAPGKMILRGADVLSIVDSPLPPPGATQTKRLLLRISVKETEALATQVDRTQVHVIMHPSKEKFRLAATERAMTVKVANLDWSMRSGDRVDVLATRQISSAQTIAENLEILATDWTEGHVTLRVTPEQAENLSLYAVTGKIRVLMRGPEK